MSSVGRVSDAAPQRALAAQDLGDREQFIAPTGRRPPSTRSSSPSRPTTKSGTSPSRLRIRTLDGVASETVDWLWSGYVPLGKVTVLEGDPGLGKSLITIALAAAATTGNYARLQGARNRPPADVFFVTYEDGVRDTIVPRLHAAGADLARAHVIEGVSDRNGDEDLFTFPDDVPELELAAQERRPCLVVVDPLSAALSSRIDSYKDQDVRRALARIARFADATGAAVIVVRHLTKGYGRSAILAGGGSIGIAGAARSVLVVGPGEGETKSSVLAVVKCNLAPRAPSLAYTIEPRAGGQPIVEWHGVTSVTADDLSAARADGAFEADAASDCDVATGCLREWLASGAVPKHEILKLARDQGVAERTLQRAAKALGVQYERQGHGREHKVLWTLPEHASARPAERPEHALSTRANPLPHRLGASERGASGDTEPSASASGGCKATKLAETPTRATAPYIWELGASDTPESQKRQPTGANLALDAALDDEAVRARRRAVGRSVRNGES